MRFSEAQITAAQKMPPSARIQWVLNQPTTYDAPPLVEFLSRTKISTPQDETKSRPFALWPAQQRVANLMESKRLIVILKARQLGISWLACGYALSLCVSNPNTPVLVFSQGQTEANEMIERFLFLYNNHSDNLPKIVGENTKKVTFDNGSSIRSLPATQRAGRSFTAALVILDEYAFMQWGQKTYTAVKPTIDNGGKLFVISSADASGSAYHQMWRMAESGGNNFTSVFLPWSAHPERGDGWREQKLKEDPNTRDVKREYPESADEAFALASGTIYEEVWEPGNGSVLDDADYQEGNGRILWAVDDGYSTGSRFTETGIDPDTGTYAADAHPRVILLCQMRPNGQLCVFDEIYRTKTLEEAQVQEALEKGYPRPEYAAIDSSAAQLRGRLQKVGMYTRKATHPVEEGIKELRRWLAADVNGFRKLVVHPRCKHLRKEMVSYRYDAQTGKPVKEFDHGPDSLRYLAWTLRYEG